LVHYFSVPSASDTIASDTIASDTIASDTIASDTAASDTAAAARRFLRSLLRPLCDE